MAKKAYLASDEYGHPWLVRRGDPSFNLIAALPKHQLPVLWFDTFRTGIVAKDLTEKALYALAGAAEDDEEMLPTVARYVALHACLHHLATVTLRPQETAIVTN